MRTEWIVVLTLAAAQLAGPFAQAFECRRLRPDGTVIDTIEVTGEDKDAALILNGITLHFDRLNVSPWGSYVHGEFPFGRVDVRPSFERNAPGRAGRMTYIGEYVKINVYGDEFVTPLRCDNPTQFILDNVRNSGRRP